MCTGDLLWFQVHTTRIVQYCHSMFWRLVERCFVLLLFLDCSAEVSRFPYNSVHIFKSSISFKPLENCKKLSISIDLESIVNQWPLFIIIMNQFGSIYFYNNSFSQICHLVRIRVCTIWKWGALWSPFQLDKISILCSWK